MELSDTQYDELVLLSTGRWNPRVGKSRQVGQIYEWIAISIFVVVVLGYGVPIVPLVFLFTNVLGILVVVILSIPILWFRLRRRKFEKLVYQNDYFVCPWCKYVLEGLDPVGQCPECGHTYEKDLCVELYKSAYCSTLGSTAKVKRERTLWRRAILLRDGMIQAEHSD